MQDEVVPKQKWEFDSKVAECFDDMLERSIPDYDNMRLLCKQIGMQFCNKGGMVVDLGASLGRAIEPYVNNGKDCMAIEVSRPMREQLKQNFGSCENLTISGGDIKEWSSSKSCSLVLSILTIQFVPINYRQRIIENIYDSLIEGGAFLFVEKVLGEDTKSNDLFVKLYHEQKENNGEYTAEQIKRKSLSLEGVLVPVTSKWNIDLMKSAGFKSVDCFWRSLNFSGWVAIK